MKINPLSPKWQHDDPDVRLQSILTGKLTQEVLSELAQSDPQAAVREAAVNLIEEKNLLLGLIDSPATSEIASKRWAVLNGSDLTHLDVVSAELPRPLLLALARHAPAEDFRLSAVDAIENEEDLIQVLQSDNFSRVHQHCATRLTSDSALQAMQQHFLDKDKNVSRILKGKLQAINHDRLERETREAALSELGSKLHQLVNAEPTPELPRRLDLLKHQWLDYRQDFGRDDELIVRHGETILPLIEQGSQIVASLPDPEEQKQALLATLIERSEALTAQLKTGQAPEHWTRMLTEIVDTWPADELALKAQHTNALTQLVNAQHRWHNIMRQHQRWTLAQFQTQMAELDWPTGFPLPDDHVNISENIENELREKEQSAERKRGQQEELQQLMSKLEHEISEGHIKAANRASGKLNNLLKDYKPAADESSRVQLLMSKLQELKDWQGFATQPKRDELCDKMQLLADDHGIPPAEKARAIKELQDAWKKLGAADSRDAQKSWNRFKKLGDEAFKPCAEYFAEQEKVRALNLEQREKICSSLEQVNADHDWSKTDWKAMQDIVTRAKSEWRQYVNVPRRAKNAIEKRFHQAMAPIQDRIRSEQDKNAAAKSALIDQVVELLASDTDPTSLANQTKNIQQQWKQIGITDRRKDQKLWKAFRARCDEVFTRRDEVKQAARTEAESAARQIQDVCTSFRKRLDDDSPLSRADIKAFKQAIADIQLTGSQGSLKSEVTRLVKQAETVLKQQVVASQQQMQREFVRRCGVLDALDAGQIEPAEAEQQLAGDTAIEGPYAAAIEARQQRPEDEQELLLVRLEILADLPSPESSQNARMAYQVERLNRELSQGVKETRSEREQVEELLIQWFATQNKLDNLKHRYQQVAQKLKLPA